MTLDVVNNSKYRKPIRLKSKGLLAIQFNYREGLIVRKQSIRFATQSVELAFFGILLLKFYFHGRETVQTSLEELRELRKSLQENRMQHEALLTQARILREHCHEVQRRCRITSREMASIIAESNPQIRCFHASSADHSAPL